MLYGALQHAVKDGFDTQAKFADAANMSNAETSLRLHRGEDSKGTLMKASLDLLATLATRVNADGVNALDVWLADVAAARKLRLEAARELTVEEQNEIYREMLSPSARRAAEKAKGLRPGSLG